MFGHLDDPASVSPGERELARVLRRARGLRARRRLVAATLAGLILVAGVAGFLASRPTTVRLRTTETGYQFNAMKGPLSVGTPVPTTALVNVVFDNAQVGFGLAAHRGQAVLAETTDGGDTWRVQNDELPPGYGESAGYPGQFEFVGANGYLWGGAPQADGSVPLWVTSDSGLSWQRAPIGPVVYDVSAIGDNVWALGGACNATATAGSTSSPCALMLEESLDGGSSWSAVGAAGFTEVMNSPPLSQRVELARITTSRSYVLTASSPDQAGIIGLVYTDDSGATWQARPVPCAGAFDLGAEIAASSTDDLWLLCGSQASAGSQSKELFRSSDGGMSWTLAASATGLGTPPPNVATADPLPLSGYVAPFSIGHKNLAVATATTAWIFPSRGSLYKTVTGGTSWVAVPSLDTAGFGTGGAGNVTFISPTQGWICTYGVGLWHTSDGVHCSPLGV
jgi:photosystem II stability/assembly factor-like uncharacterized protein